MDHIYCYNCTSADINEVIAKPDFLKIGSFSITSVI